jgi:hypothetical protein
MKHLYLIATFLILFGEILEAQDQPQKATGFKLGVSFSSFGNNDIVRDNELMGAASYHGEDFYTLGVNVIYPLNKWFEIESGLDYSRHSVLIKPAPGIDMPSHTGKFSLMCIPVTARVNFLRFFFINGGALLDFDASASMPVDSQTGIGLLLGVGVKYDFKFGGSVFFNPYTKMHSQVSFMEGDNRQKLIEDGFRLGITMKL